MWAKWTEAWYGAGLQFRLFVALTGVVALGMAAMLACQVYLLQDYFIRQAETDLRNSNYLLSRVLGDTLHEHDERLLQMRLDALRLRYQPCGLQLRSDSGDIVFRQGTLAALDDSFNPAAGECFHTILPVVHGDKTYGLLRIGFPTGPYRKAQEELIRNGLLAGMLVFMLLLLPFFLQIRRLLQPLTQLSDAARRVTSGESGVALPLLRGSNDEVSRLTRDFGEMLAALTQDRQFQADCLHQMQQEKSLLNGLLTTLPVGVFVADQTHILYCNPAFRRMWQLDAQEPLVGLPNDALLARVGDVAERPEQLRAIVREVLAAHAPLQPTELPLKNGVTLRMSSNVVLVPEDGKPVCRFWLFEDITREQTLRLMAEQKANRDGLTGLYNRQHFDQEAARLFAHCQRHAEPLAMLLFDLDDFKPVNDRYGHAAGDRVLRGIAAAVSAGLRRDEMLFRLGGDEFGLLLPAANAQQVAHVAQRIVHAVAALSFDFDGDTARVGCSLGSAHFPQDATTLPDLLRRADQAMYAAKRRGKNQWLAYQHDNPPD